MLVTPGCRHQGPQEEMVKPDPETCYYARKAVRAGSCRAPCSAPTGVVPLRSLPAAHCCTQHATGLPHSDKRSGYAHTKRWQALATPHLPCRRRRRRRRCPCCPSHSGAPAGSRRTGTRRRPGRPRQAPPSLVAATQPVMCHRGSTQQPRQVRAKRGCDGLLRAVSGSPRDEGRRPQAPLAGTGMPGFRLQHAPVA